MITTLKKALYYGWWLIRFVAKMSISLVLSVALRHRDEYKNLWLIMELPQEARDNGYWLYKYIIDNHPETNVRYVLSDKSPDYAKMPAKNRITKPYSWQHYISYILSTRSISTHMYGACPGRYYVKLFSMLIPNKEEVFLQHGVLANIIHTRGFSGWAVVSSSSEEEYFIDSGYTEKKFLRTGLCRFDNLSDSSKELSHKTILIMPTYRSWLGGFVQTDLRSFRADDFYKKWQSLLTNKDLNSFIEGHGYKIIFYPHRQMQQFAKYFSGSDNVEIATKDDYDVQELLKKSSLLVTDYSSVFYDFSYMKKPVLLYPFDKKRFYTDHHKSSGKLYPFGEYCQNEDMLVEQIKKSAKNNFKISKKDISRVEEFFTYTDTDNCKRNFETIRELGLK